MPKDFWENMNQVSVLLKGRWTKRGQEVATPVQLHLYALSFIIIYINWHCLKLADVVGGRPNFIMVDSCVAEARAPGRRWVSAGLVERVLRRRVGTIALVNRLLSGRGRGPHRLSFPPY
jgi:hypothetical protein